MDNGMLRDVIAVEKEIQQTIERAQRSAQELLEQRNAAREEQYSSEERKILESLLVAEEKSKQEAGARAAELLRRAEESAGRIAHVPDQIVDTIAMNHLRKIVPG